ncbi:hypothetical protein APSETT444_010069 [Aspergillus pseudonomiae]
MSSHWQEFVNVLHKHYLDYPGSRNDLCRLDIIELGPLDRFATSVWLRAATNPADFQRASYETIKLRNFNFYQKNEGSILIKGPSLHIQFEELWLREPNAGESDYVLSHAVLEAMADDVWLRQDIWFGDRNE